MTEAQQHEVAGAARERAVAGGAVLCREGEPAEDGPARHGALAGGAGHLVLLGLGHGVEERRGWKGDHPGL